MTTNKADSFEKSIPFEQILDDTNQLIQISDMDTFSMMYANQTARDFTLHQDAPYRGEKCYKYMMGLEEQCPFCPIRQIENTDSFVTEIDNGQQVFTVKTKRIQWEGKDAFIEYATDITTTKRAQQIFESQMQLLINSIPEAQGIFHLNLTKDLCISSNGTSHNVEKIQDSKSVDMLIQSISEYVPDKQKEWEFFCTFQRMNLMSAYSSGKTEISQETLSYFDDGSIRWVRMTARLMMNPNNGDLEAILYGMDINEEKLFKEKMALAEREKAQILEKSKRDVLTGVYSKKAFEQISNEYLNTCKGQPFAVIFLDLDNFKDINDSLGHLFGDKVIIDVADKLQTIFSNKDIISRFGGDEYCILIKNISQETLINKLDFMLRKLMDTYRDDEQSVKVTASIGATYCNGEAENILPFLEKADNALYQAKRNGRNQYQILW